MNERRPTDTGEAMMNEKRFRNRPRREGPKPVEVYYIARDQGRPRKGPSRRVIAVPYQDKP